MITSAFRLDPLRLVAVALMFAAAGSLVAADRLQPGRTVWLHAHNCYPEKGQWADRLQRALAVRTENVAIEQDIAWHVDPSTGRGRSVLSHESKPDGSEPTLESHFFDRLRPLMERALAARRTETWPLMVLHLDFKTNEPEHHRAVWNLLGQYEGWLTTARRGAVETEITPFEPGPLLVLTEAGERQVDTFYHAVPIGARLRIFGTVPPPVFGHARTSEERAAAIHGARPETLIPSRATSYRRWTNFPWAAVELGGPPHAGPWTPEDDRRLRAIVSRAHQQGLWIRFYTLNGHPPGGSQGWTASYNFGSLDAALTRMRAARDAGVEFIATDQYEDLGRVLDNHPDGR